MIKIYLIRCQTNVLYKPNDKVTATFFAIY